MKQSRRSRKNGRKSLGQGGSVSRNGKKDTARPTTESGSPNVWEILGRFDQALSLVIVCQQSLAAKESADVGDEEEVLRQGIRLLKEVHKEIDRSAAWVKGRAATDLKGFSAP